MEQDKPPNIQTSNIPTRSSKYLYKWICILLFLVIITILALNPSLLYDMIFICPEKKETRTDIFTHDIEQLNIINDRLRVYLNPLVQTFYFRYVRLDLNRSCPFWKHEPLNDDSASINNTSIDKHVKKSDNIFGMKLLSTWGNISLGNIKFSLRSKDTRFMNYWGDDSVDFAEIHKDEASDNGVYVNLLENPERYTGYSGKSARQVWTSIYSENCFQFKKIGKLYTKLDDRLFDESKSSSCSESLLFYNLISGFHASVSMHIAHKYFNVTNGLFYPDLNVYKERIGNHPKRIRNLHFTFMILLRALQKARPYLISYPYQTGNMYENQKVRELVQKASNITIECSNLFDEKSLFRGDASDALKREFRHHFKNISRIMDCVDCQKCRLWGKIQISGIGTALKILFSYGDDQTAYSLTKTEIIAFINTVNRLSESIEYNRYFQQMIETQQKKQRYYECLCRVMLCWIGLIGLLVFAYKK